jgi:hypothetical protein
MSAPVPSASVSIGVHMWMHWLEIACRAEHEADEARARCLAIGPADAGFGEAMTQELQNAMLAICTASNAIDALYGELKGRIPIPEETRELWRRKRTARHRQIFETLKSGCALGARTNQWPARLDALYNLRDPVVHHEMAIRSVVPHPNGIVNSGQENADYCLENARAAVDVAYDVVLATIETLRTPAAGRGPSR